MIDVYVCISACMYVCVYMVCIYACTYVCVYMYINI
jgi:hypothetical protein